MRLTGLSQPPAFPQIFAVLAAVLLQLSHPQQQHQEVVEQQQQIGDRPELLCDRLVDAARLCGWCDTAVDAHTRCVAEHAEVRDTTQECPRA
jgi:hypothetical protein